MPVLGKKVVKSAPVHSSVVLPDGTSPYWTTTDRETARIYKGDVLEVLRTLPSGSVQCVVTSPPYWSLRSYLDEKDADKHREIGAEKIPDCLGWSRGDNCAEKDWQNGCYVCRLSLVFRECKQVLRDDGVLWLNLGDTYSSGGGFSPGSPSNTGREKRFEDTGKNRLGDNSCDPRFHDRAKVGSAKNVDLPTGNLIGVPWRVALAMQQDGWVLRQDLIWCLSGGTWVYAQTQKGEMPMMIKDAARLDPKTVKLWNGQKWTQVLGWSRSHRTGEELELVLRSGERISCTQTHQFPTNRGLLKASDIKIGDKLQIAKLPEPCDPITPEGIPELTAWFVGLYLAEGSKNGTDGKKLCIAGHAKETERWEKIQQLVKFYGCSATLRTHGKNQTITVYGRVVVSIVDEYISGRTAKDKGLKVKCWSHTNKWLMQLLLGYLSGDGHWDAKNNRWRLGFCRNYNWERDLRTLAARLNVRLVLNTAFTDGFGQTFPTFRGEIRFTESDHFNRKNTGEVVEIRKSRCREVWDIGVEDEPHLFALASGVLTHNSKPSPMPESVRNRCTKAHEYVFLFSKKGSGYFYDAEAIKEKSVSEGQLPGGSRYTEDDESSDAIGGKHTKRTLKDTPVASNANKRSVWTVEDEEAMFWWLRDNHPDLLGQFLQESINKGSVWTIASQGYAGAHFATYPEKLITPMILAGSSERGACSDCGTPYRRVTEDRKLVRERPNDYVKRTGEEGTGNVCSNSVAGVESKTVGWSPTCGCHGLQVEVPVKKLKSLRVAKGVVDDKFKIDEAVRSISGQEWSDWQSAEHGDEDYVESVEESHSKVGSLLDHDAPPPVPCVILDPFLGSGTTVACSIKHGRRGWGIELNQKYIDNNAVPRIAARLLDMGLGHLVKSATPVEVDGDVVDLS